MVGVLQGTVLGGILVLLPEMMRLRYAGAVPLFFELGPDEHLQLESWTRLTGRGQLRVSGHWHPFRFECDLDADSGGVNGFRVTFFPEGR